MASYSAGLLKGARPRSVKGGRGEDPRKFMGKSGGRSKSDEDIEHLRDSLGAGVSGSSAGRMYSEEDIDNILNEEAQRAMDEETNIVDPDILKALADEFNKKKKKKKKTKASKKAGGGQVYRGREYARGGRVAKYKG